jgi:hypothetical protein
MIVSGIYFKVVVAFQGSKKGWSAIWAKVVILATNNGQKNLKNVFLLIEE